jgi:hypothetical protein
MTSYFKMATVQLCFSKQSPLSKRDVVTVFNMEEHLFSDNVITFGDEYSVMKLRFAYQRG